MSSSEDETGVKLIIIIIIIIIIKEVRIHNITLQEIKERKEMSSLNDFNLYPPSYL